MVLDRINRSEKGEEDPVILFLFLCVMKYLMCKRLFTSTVYLVLPGMMVIQTGS